jgi:potassium-transporting ATPase KdpC subunit
MSFFQEFTTAIRVAIALWVLTAVLYPILMLGIGAIFPYQANGSMITNSQGKVVGSALIGQNFTSDKYFWGRPSTTNYSSFTDKEKDPKNIAQTTGLSGASNFAPSNPDLIKRVKDSINSLKTAGTTPTADLVYTSGSSLDPHISPEAAKAQSDRVAKARSLAIAQIEPLITKNTESRFLGIFGEPVVNVLKLNLDLDQLSGNKS